MAVGERRLVFACSSDKSCLTIHQHTLGPSFSSTCGASRCPLSRMGFLTQLKCKKVGIDKEKTSRVIVREKLSKRAVVKEDGLGWVYLQERRLTPIGT